MSKRSGAVAVTWIAFCVALALALPQPPDATRLTLGAIFGAILVWFGFFLSSRCRRVEGHEARDRARLTLVSLAEGALLGALLLLLLDFFARVEPALRSRFAARIHEPLWRPLALSFESSILEEVVFRLFAMTFLVWLASRFTRNEKTQFVFGLAGSALFFGAAHLSAWSSATHAGLLLYACVLLLNGAGGTLFGWIYWRSGLPYAIAAHFAADMVVQTMGPRVLG